jgi:putative lipoprotein
VQAHRRSRHRHIIAAAIAAALMLAPLLPAGPDAVPLPSAHAMTAPRAGQSVTGAVTYRERIALAPDAHVVVQVWDVTLRSDWRLVGRQVQTAAGQPPIPFAVAVDPDRIRPDGFYIVEARILQGEHLRWINPVGCPVLTKGYPAAVQVVVRPFTIGAPSVALSSHPPRDCQYDRR